MPHAALTTAVNVHFPYQEQKVVSGPFEAMTCLTDRWPNMAGLKFLKARMSCRAAMDGRLSADVARKDFVDAVDEAGGSHRNT